MPFIRYDFRLKEVARNLRKNQTKSEREMWKFLKENYPDQKFLRQKALDYFIPDFYCLEKKLIIEIDGEVHDNRKERDAERDNLFKMKYKIKTIRFTNNEVMENKELLIKVLDEALHS